MAYSKNHTLYYNDDNKEIPSATTILKILNKPNLVYWANHLGFNHRKYDEVLNDASKLGTEVHSLIENFLNKNMFIYIKTEIPEFYYSVYRCLGSFFQWYNNNSIKPIFTERSFISKRFGGTIDFYGIVNDKLTIVDFKTSKNIYYSMFIQLALYTLLLEDNNRKVEQVGIVLCNENKADNKFILRKDLDPYLKIADKLVDLFHLYYDLNEKEWRDTIL